ncbi:hypothetical protein BD413DRAFT_464534, partial [Trametes elegans]
QRRALAVSTPSCRRGVPHCIPARRHYSSPPPPPAQAAPDVDHGALDRWISADKHLALHDTLRPEHLADLYITLPTRDGTARAFAPPRECEPLNYGHHLAFFHPRNPERALRSDGTDTDFCPPEPFTRRMWAGGRMAWKRPLCVGDRATAQATIGAVTKKGFEKGAPMVFVSQKIEYRKRDSDEVCIEEDRSHVYLAVSGNRRAAKEVTGLPMPDFAFEYTPSPTTLFRFSALTFNGHYIHLDKDYAQKSEGYPERLVHGPLTALMLLDVTALSLPGAKFKTFEYRALNPIVVNRKVKICGAKTDKETVLVWAEETSSKAVGMMGKVTLYNCCWTYNHKESWGAPGNRQRTERPIVIGVRLRVNAFVAASDAFARDLVETLIVLDASMNGHSTALPPSTTSHDAPLFYRSPLPPHPRPLRLRHRRPPSRLSPRRRRPRPNRRLLPLTARRRSARRSARRLGAVTCTRVRVLMTDGRGVCRLSMDGWCVVQSSSRSTPIRVSRTRQWPSSTPSSTTSSSALRRRPPVRIISSVSW